MSDNYDLSDLSPDKYNLSDLAPSAESDRTIQDESKTSYAFDMARALIPFAGVLPKSVMSKVSDILKEEFKGITEELSGVKSEGGGIPRQVGRVAAKYGPAALGAGMAAAAVPTAGLSLIPTAAVTALSAGLGSAGGEGIRQITSAALSGKPEEIQPSSSIKTGIIAAAIDLGIGIPLAGVKAVSPVILQVFDKIPAESIKRAIQFPSIIKIGPGARNIVERSGIRALESVQKAFSNARKMAGQEVETALNSLESSARGEKFNISKVADMGEDILLDAGVIPFPSKAAPAKVVDIAEGIETPFHFGESLKKARPDNPAIARAMGAELGRIRNLIKSIRDTMASPKQIVALRREIDNLSEFSHGGMQKISSDIGQRVIKKMGEGLREVLDEIADVTKFEGLKSANNRFTLIARAYDEVRPVISSRDSGANSLLNQFNRISARFNEGGLRTEIIESVGKNVPKYAEPITKAMNNLIDHIASRELTRLPLGTVSGPVLNFIRLLSSPQTIGAAIKYSKPAGAIVSGAESGVAKKVSDATTSK